MEFNSAFEGLRIIVKDKTHKSNYNYTYLIDVSLNMILNGSKQFGVLMF